MQKILDIKTLKFGRYRRKSTEGEDKQVQSIEDQLRELLAMEKRDGINVVVDYEEKQSAFHPGRPNFAKLVADTEAGKIDAWDAWHANRLSRNPIDAGRIIYLMDTGKLKLIKTTGAIYRNTSDDKFILGLEFGMSKKDSDDKGVAVKRGLQGRSNKGLPNGVASIGYLNDLRNEKGNRKWKIDPDCFPKIQRLIKTVLLGRCSPRQLLKMAEEMNLRTHLRKKQGGKYITRSYLYLILANPVYAGFFFAEGEQSEEQRYELDTTVPRMITEEEFWRIQDILGRKGRPRPQKHETAYNDISVCDECGGTVYPDYKFQLICPSCKYKFAHRSYADCPKCKTSIEEMEGPTYLDYVYYYCTSKKKTHEKSCASIEQKLLDEKLLNYVMNNLAISEAISNWCIRNISEIKDRELEDGLMLAESRKKAEDDIKRKLSNLLDLRLNKGDLSPEDTAMYDKKEEELKRELKIIEDISRKTNGNDGWENVAHKKFSLMKGILEIIEKGSLNQKKEVLLALGANLRLGAKKLNVINAEEVQLFVDALKRARSKNDSFEPINTVDVSGRNEVFTSVSPIMLPG